MQAFCYWQDALDEVIVARSSELKSPAWYQGALWMHYTIRKKDLLDLFELVKDFVASNVVKNTPIALVYSHL